MNKNNLFNIHDTHVVIKLPYIWQPSTILWSNDTCLKTWFWKPWNTCNTYLNKRKKSHKENVFIYFLIDLLTYKTWYNNLCADAYEIRIFFNLNPWKVGQLAGKKLDLSVLFINLFSSMYVCSTKEVRIRSI